MCYLIDYICIECLDFYRKKDENDKCKNKCKGFAINIIEDTCIKCINKEHIFKKSKKLNIIMKG